jgi:membrane-bound lytic murein transglycosylase D
MVKTAIMRVLAHRKIEAVTIGAVAALSAAGFVRNDDPTLAVSTAVSKVVAHQTANGDVTRVPDGRGAEPGRQALKEVDLPDLDHPRVESWIKRFTGSQRRSMAIYLERKTRYEDLITTKLAQRGMPKDLIYLAMIESGFNPRAKSPVAARGLWQFMSPTARQYGLKVTRRVDERTNPARSTDAAIRYLNTLHKRFGSWYLAAAAYNTGQGRVARIMRQETGRTRGSDADYYRIAHRLPKETRDYVPKLIAAARIGNNPAAYGFSAD